MYPGIWAKRSGSHAAGYPGTLRYPGNTTDSSKYLGKLPTRAGAGKENTRYDTPSQRSAQVSREATGYAAGGYPAAKYPLAVYWLVDSIRASIRVSVSGYPGKNTYPGFYEF